ncbi:MAG: hypothetical protein AAFO89_03375 [Planctomycetota bacterium]
MCSEYERPTADGDAPLKPRWHAAEGWREHAFEREWLVAASRRSTWRWLNDPETFTRQIWPYKVEFLEGSGEGGASGFAPGVLNAHHGPLLNAAGVITCVDHGEDGDGRYRELLYFYGSFVLGMRCVRPRRLAFWIRDRGEGCAVKVRLESSVSPIMHAPWSVLNRAFWLSFPGWMRSGARKRDRAKS